MDNQCDRCGAELPLAPDQRPFLRDLYKGEIPQWLQDQPEPTERLSFHIEFEADHLIEPDGDEYDPDEAFDLCPACWNVFCTFWQGFYHVTTTPHSGKWTRCQCGHIAQDHNLDGTCGPADPPTGTPCTCRKYTGHEIPVEAEPTLERERRTR